MQYFFFFFFKKNQKVVLFWIMHEAFVNDNLQKIFSHPIFFCYFTYKFAVLQSSSCLANPEVIK